MFVPKLKGCVCVCVCHLHATQAHPASGETIYYGDYQRTPESCGTDACAEAISRIDDAALFDMKTGFTVRVPIYIPD
jgi:hypothetical protein